MNGQHFDGAVAKLAGLAFGQLGCNNAETIFHSAVRVRKNCEIDLFLNSGKSEWRSFLILCRSCVRGKECEHYLVERTQV